MRVEVSLNDCTEFVYNYSFKIDNPEDATIGAFLFSDLMHMLDSSSDLDDEIDEMLQAFEDRCNRSVLHTLCFY